MKHTITLCSGHFFSIDFKFIVSYAGVLGLRTDRQKKKILLQFQLIHLVNSQITLKKKFSKSQANAPILYACIDL